MREISGIRCDRNPGPTELHKTAGGGRRKSILGAPPIEGVCCGRCVASACAAVSFARRLWGGGGPKIGI